MRTQPQDVIAKLEQHNSRLDKEAILHDAMQEGLDEFFEGVAMCLDAMVTFGVKQVPERSDVLTGQGLAWPVFKELADKLANRELTGHDARDAIELAMSGNQTFSDSIFLNQFLQLNCFLKEYFEYLL